MDDDEILKAAKIIRARRETERRQAVTDKILASTTDVPVLSDLTMRYPIVYADPAWKYRFSKDSRNPCNYYPIMELEEIKALPVSDIATPDAILFLWATATHLREAMDVIEAWGFQYCANLVWAKESIGLGWFVRYQHETLLIAKRGKMPTPAPENRPASVLSSPRREHSKKPDELYGLIERMYPTLPKIELFARVRREGWDAWGNQVLPSAAPNTPFEENALHRFLWPAEEPA